MRRTASQSGTAGGFTLVELIVVVALVSLLVALLLPALASARDTARAVQCLSRQRQLGLMATMYRHDFHGALPRPTIGTSVVGMTDQQQHQAVWYNAADAYLRKAVPIDASGRSHDAWKHDPVWESFDEATRTENRTLKMNAYLKGNNDNADPPHFTYDRAIHRPARTVLFVDGQSADVHPDGSNDAHFAATPGRVALRHDAGANVAFADGHGRHVRQAINDGLVVPGWFVPGDPRQELVWRVDE